MYRNLKHNGKLCQPRPQTRSIVEDRRPSQPEPETRSIVVDPSSQATLRDRASQGQKLAAKWETESATARNSKRSNRRSQPVPETRSTVRDRASHGQNLERSIQYKYIYTSSVYKELNIPECCHLRYRPLTWGFALNGNSLLLFG